MIIIEITENSFWVCYNRPTIFCLVQYSSRDMNHSVSGNDNESNLEDDMSTTDDSKRSIDGIKCNLSQILVAGFL